MNHVASQSKHMTAECKETMMEVQYFMARDFSLDPHLYAACRVDAQDICQVDEHWYSNKDTQNKNLVFACLGKHALNRQILFFTFQL